MSASENIENDKEQQLVAKLEDLFDPKLAETVAMTDHFHAKLKIVSDARQIKSVLEGFELLKNFCDTWISRGSKAYVLETPENIPTLQGFRIVCLIDNAVWTAFENVRRDFQIGNTVKLIGAWGQVLKCLKTKDKFFVFFLLSLE
ncbi:hypothetical protein MHSWG343_05220 [Candidatus Mycoplasma haematohominis]|uniref:Uncharacterized protein n=1 Tax=Candidatus Mycoplasma haematohominis TaxID=1494318 RepID=A0A478FTV9_9MOLU|nr:hypothetical protein MHSWG343_05220 [Candidatus Mycoplasma haemohominis]